MADEKKHQYAVKNHGFNMWLRGEHVHAKNGVLEVNASQHAELQELVKDGKRPDIAAELTYLDHDAAEKIARDHMAKQPAAAHAGAANSTTKDNTGESTLKDAQKLDPPKGQHPTLAERLRSSREGVVGPVGNEKEAAEHQQSVHNVEGREEENIPQPNVAPGAEENNNI